MKLISLILMALLISVNNFSESKAEEIQGLECTKASTEVEQLICGDSELQQLDTEINKWYKKVIRYITLVYGVSRDEDAGSYNKWLKDRDSLNCTPANKDKKACLVLIYNDGIQVFKNRMLAFELWRACGTVRPRPCNFKPAEKLLKAGADLNGYEYYKDGSEGPVFYHALGGRTVDVIKFAVANGAEIGVEKRKYNKSNVELFYTDNFNDWDLLLKLGTPINISKDMGGLSDGKSFERTPLFIASTKAMLNPKDEESFNMINKLIKYGADINFSNKNGDTILTLLFQKRYLQKEFPYDYQRTLNVINLLISNGADVKHKNKEGHNALYYLRKKPYDMEESYYSQFERLLQI